MTNTTTNAVNSQAPLSGLGPLPEIKPLPALNTQWAPERRCATCQSLLGRWETRHCGACKAEGQDFQY